MKNPIKVLLVSDSPQQRKALMGLFCREGYRPHIKRVEDAHSLEEALLRDEWDLILAREHIASKESGELLKFLEKGSQGSPVMLLSNGTDLPAGWYHGLISIPETDLEQVAALVKKEIRESFRLRLYRRTKERALGSEEHLESALKALLAMPCAMVFLDAEGKVRRWNQAAADLFGLVAHEVLGQPHPFSGSDLDRVGQTISRTLKTRLPEMLEVTVPRARGTSQRIALRVEPLGPGDAQSSGTLVLAAPTSRIHDAEQAWKAERKLGMALLQASPAMFVAIDRSGRILMMNRAFLEKAGYQNREVLGQDYLNLFVPEEDHAGVRAVFKTLVTHKKETRNVNRVRRRDGSEMLVEWHGRPITNSLGQVDYFFGMGLDITKRVKAEEALRESEEKFRRLFHAASDAIYLFALEEQGRPGRFLEVNEETCRRLAYSREELLGMTPLEVELVSFHDQLFEKMGSIGETGHTTFTTVHRSQEGTQIPTEVSAHLFPLKDQDAVLAIARDITKRKQAQETLEQTIRKLRKAVEGTIHAMAATTEIRDPYTAGHQKRVSRLAAAIARRMDLSRSDVDGIRRAAAIHDVGKTCVPAEILSKPGRLNQHELSLIRTHPQVGYEVIKEIDFSWPVAQTVLQHHERMDGSGYPQGLSGESIALGARILAVADVVEAMSSHRPYRPALGIDEALKEIEAGKGRLYDVEAAEACLSLFRDSAFRLV